MDRNKIREIFLANGFTIRDGQTDLKDYVYKAAEALLDAQSAEVEPIIKSLAQAVEASSKVSDSLHTVLEAVSTVVLATRGAESADHS